MSRRGGRGRPGVGPGPFEPGVDPFGVLWKEAEEPPPRARGRRGRDRAGLSRDVIVRTALRIADDEGYDAVSMRRIATELGVGTMSLYHYVPTKDDLVDLMHDHVMGELVLSEEELGSGWREGLAQISRRTREVWLRHTWLVMGAGERPHFGPRTFAHVEQSIGVVAGLPLEPIEMMQMLGAADDYVIGFVLREAASSAALRRSGMEATEYMEHIRPHLERLVTARAGEYPNLARIAGIDWDVDADERFERGLQWLLDGLAAWLAERTDR